MISEREKDFCRQLLQGPENMSNTEHEQIQGPQDNRFDIDNAEYQMQSKIAIWSHMQSYAGLAKLPAKSLKGCSADDRYCGLQEHEDQHLGNNDAVDGRTLLVGTMAAPKLRTIRSTYIILYYMMKLYIYL